VAGSGLLGGGGGVVVLKAMLSIKKSQLGSVVVTVTMLPAAGKKISALPLLKLGGSVKVLEFPKLS
jgi:hypothetical protein